MVLFGGAIGDTNKYNITRDTFILDMSTLMWKRPNCCGVLPTPRAAHACATVDIYQMVVYGGAAGSNSSQLKIDGSLASDELFLLDLKKDENNPQWMIVPVVGTTPGRRYGHSMIYSKPNLIIFGGNNGTDTINDVWILNIERAPFNWIKLPIMGESPSPRTYHSAALCTFGSATGMMVVFGGRGSDQTPLNDAWGLRKHRDGRWDWVLAPCKPNTDMPLNRYQHGSAFVGTFMLIVGGRTNHAAEQMGLEVYDTETSEWHKYRPGRRFRHACWTTDTSLFVYGGFEYDAPIVPTDSLMRVDLVHLFSNNKYLLAKITSLATDTHEQFTSGRTPSSPVLPGTNLSAVKPVMMMPSAAADKRKRETLARSEMTDTKPKPPGQSFHLASSAIIAVPSGSDPHGKVLKSVPLKKLQEESKKIFVQIRDPRLPNQPEAAETVHSLFINQLLRPRDWAMQQNTTEKFRFKKELIASLATECVKILQQQPIILNVRAPVKVFGDIHGQYQDLMRFFDLWGMPSEDINGDIEAYDYLFLGDYVDRGSHSLETICLLMALKVKYPNQIHLLRGNHEDRWINNAFGFADECATRLDEDLDDPNSIFNKINEVFDWLPLAAIIEDKIICLHGGIGSTLDKLVQIEALKRPLEVIHEVQNETQQLVVDILWSDPTDTDQELGIQHNQIRDPNSTGNIVKFGPDMVEKFLGNNGLNLILRAHECVMDGFERFAGGTLITIFSATDYCGRHKNAGAVLFITRKFEIIPKLIYPIDTGDNNWMEDGEAGQDIRPPTPPRWTTAQFPRSDSFN